LNTNTVALEDLSDRLDDLMQTKAMRQLRRRYKVFLNMIALCHMLACCLKMVDEGILRDAAPEVRDDIWLEYLVAVYWAVTTITTVGYGDITPGTALERCFVSMAMLLGATFYGYLVGTITSIVASIDLNCSAYYDRLDLIHAWLSHHSIPIEMKRTLRRYFQQFLANRCAVNEADIWHDLSPSLQKEVGQYVIHENVKSNPLFDGLSVGSIVGLQSIMQRVTVLPGRFVTEKGELGYAMYIIVSGSVQLETEDWSMSKLVRHSQIIRPGETQAITADEELEAKPDAKWLGVGQSFGEEVLLGFMDEYEYTARVLKKVHMEMVVQTAFMQLFQSMPTAVDRMRQNAMELNPRWKSHGFKRNPVEEDNINARASMAI